jgi:hypothetical protein
MKRRRTQGAKILWVIHLARKAACNECENVFWHRICGSPWIDDFYCWMMRAFQEIPKKEKALAALILAVFGLNKTQGLFYVLPFSFGRNHLNDLLAGILFVSAKSSAY